MSAAALALASDGAAVVVQKEALPHCNLPPLPHMPTEHNPSHIQFSMTEHRRAAVLSHTFGGQQKTRTTQRRTIQRQEVCHTVL